MATVAEVGKQVAGTLGFRPRWSAAPACLRTPLGPSDRVMAGMPGWEKVMIGVDVVLAAALIALEVLVVKKGYAKRKEEEVNA